MAKVDESLNLKNWLRQDSSMKGFSDTCRCFFCGLVVHSWETHDDAFEEHLKHSPKCHYVEFHM